VFFSQFLMPSAWLFGASLLYGLGLRVGLRWPLTAAGGLLLLELVAGLTPALAADVHRAQAGYERRGGLIALTALSSSIQRGAPFANLDVSQPDRFDCAPPPPSAAGSRTAAELLGHRNVILISVDTLRKDALRMTDEDGKPITPNLRAIEAQSLAFERAVTTYPATLFALGSALTGQSPSEVMFAPRQPDNLFTQTRALFQETLIAFPSVGWFKRPPVPQLLTQTASPAYFANAERETQWLLQRLRESRTRKRRVLAWIHYFEPHTSKSAGRGHKAEQTARVSYGGLVHEVDVQIGRLWSELERLGYLRDSLVIVFSDHGEALGEFGYFGHHVYLNQFATDVPLLLHRPGGAPSHSDAQASLRDIAPTVLAWLGLPTPPGDARDLITLAADGGERYAMSEAFPVRGRALYDVARMPITSPTALRERMRLLRTAAIDYQPKVSLVSAHYRLIVNRVTGAEEFYDRVRDPAERNDLSQDNLPEHARMRAALAKEMRALSERIYCGVQRAAKPPL
jgi:arylsulfatase A-like enzyme